MKLKIDLPEGIDFEIPNTITPFKIAEYIENIHNKYGDFCGDCKYLNDNDKCNKGHRPRRYDLVLGKYDSVIIKKFCKDFKLGKPPKIKPENYHAIDSYFAV